MRKIIYGLFLVFTLVSCTSQRTIVNTPPTNSHTATPIDKEPIATFTPIVTATPITSNEQDLGVALAPYLNLNNSCKKTDRLSNSDLKVIFLENAQEDNQSNFVSEVAESKNNKYIAYIVQQYVLNIMSNSLMPIYCEGCGKVYLKNIQDGKKYQIDWKAFPSGNLMIYSLIWVNDNILIVREAQSEDLYLVFGFDVNNQELVYYSEVSC